MELNKVYTIPFVSLAVMAGGARADVVGSVADATKSIFGGSKANAGATISTFTNGGNVDTEAGAQGRGPKTMADGVVVTSGGSGAAVNTKVALGVFDNSSVRTKAKTGDGAEAYAGSIISTSRDKQIIRTFISDYCPEMEVLIMTMCVVFRSFSVYFAQY